MPLDAAIITGVGLMSFAGAFGASLALAKRRDPVPFDKRLTGPSSPSRLALKALGIGTICAVTGVSCMVMGVKYLFDIRDVNDLRNKMGHLVPDKYKLSKSNSRNI
jgi:hypothetical protein